MRVPLVGPSYLCQRSVVSDFVKDFVKEICRLECVREHDRFGFATIERGIAHQLIGTVVLLAVALILEHTIRPTALLLPLLLVPQFLVTAGLGWLMASLGVFIRDMPQINQLTLMTWMYLTPIYYPENIIPPKYQWMVNLNPMAPLVRNYRRILLEGSAPDWRGLGVTTVFALVCFVVGYWWFQRTGPARGIKWLRINCAEQCH